MVTFASRKHKSQRYAKNMIIRHILLVVWLSAALAACGRTDDNSPNAMEEKSALMASFMQGVWIDDDSGAPFIKVRGDSIYFASRVNVPIAYRVEGDTLIIYGGEAAKYLIDMMDESTFRFFTASGDLMSLHKSENDTLNFGSLVQSPVPEHEVIEKDSVIFSQGVRYRGYVYINSTDIKVSSPYFSEDGMYMDNVFFDNVIHICVYQGTQRLFGKDIRREMFEGIVPDDYLRYSILDDMNFIGVSPRGYTYSATICSPGSPSCYCVEVFVSKEGELKLTLVQ